MRTTIILLFSCVFISLAESGYTQNAKVTINKSNANLKEVLNEIESQTDYLFIYNNEVNTNRDVSVNTNDESVRNVLTEVLQNTDIHFDMEGNHIILSHIERVKSKQDISSTAIVQQEGKTVTGTILDTNGEPIIGANIIEKGTSNGTVTDYDGNFTLNVSDDAVLRISYIGYLEQEIDTEGRNTVNVELVEDTQSLEEVVVVGYGVQKKVNLTGSVSTINYDKDLENRPITNASQALSGKVPGVWVSQNSGAPGSDGATIRIRGYGTLNNTNPLVLIDGIEGRIAELNPNDIESMTVLKDAASAAIYGSRAANGVILIETKKGDGEEKTTVTYNGYFGLQQLGRRYDLISNSAEFMGYWNQANINSGGSAQFPDDVIEAFKKGGDPYKYPNTNFFDEVFRTAPTTQHNLSLTSSSKKSNTYVSINYLKQDGIIKNTDSERYGINFNHESEISERIKLGARMRYMRKTTFQPYDGISRVIYMMANGRPFTTPYLQDGKTFGGSQAIYLSGERKGESIVDTRNPFPDLYNGQNLYTNNFVKANFFTNIDIAKGLVLNAQYNAQYNSNTRDRYNQTHFTYTDLDLNNKSKPLDFPSTLNIFRGTTEEFHSTFIANLNYNRIFKDNHEISGLLGMQTEDLTRKLMDAQKSDPPKEGLHQVSSGTSNPIANGNELSWRMLSYFGRINYALMSKYLFEANLRADASSRFASGNRWGFFPAFSAAWRLSEEAPIKNLGLFDNFKIRASWGELGNQNIGSSSNSDYFPYMTIITQNYGTSYNFGNQLAPGAAVTALVDPSITWETTTSTDIGLDLGFLNNRLTLEADYFIKKTRDIIVQLPIPNVLGGLTAPFENIGEMTNKGLELNLNWSDRNAETGINYNIGVNLTTTNNTVDKFRGGESPDQLYLIREGYSYKSLYGFIQEGVYQSDEEAKTHMNKNGYVPKAGDLKYKDVNGDGKLDYRDKKEFGNTIPELVYGINGSLSWNNFDLSFVFSGIAGVKGYFQNTWTEPLGISGATITERWRDAWTPENPSTTTPRMLVNDTWNRQQSSFWSTDMSWFKLKNLQIGYTIPKSITNKVLIQNLYVYLNGTDLFTIVSDKYEGFDPERDTFSDGYNHYPIPKIYSVGLNITF